MKLNTTINETSKSVSLCLRCNMCTYGEWPENYPLCPMYSSEKIFTLSPGGLMYLVRALIENKIGYNLDLFKPSFMCINCRACDKICEIIPIPKPHLLPTEIIRLLRYGLVKQGLIPNIFIKKLYREIVKRNSNLEKMEIKIPEEIKNKKLKYILFVEESYPERQKPTFRSTLEVFKKIGVEVYVFIDQWGSGADLYDLGFIDELRSLLEKKSELINHLAGKNLIFIDPHTQEFVLKNWQQYVKNGKKLMGQHLSEVILSLFKKFRVKTGNGRKVTVSYHDPCILGRGLGIYDPPRELLTFFKGVTLLELTRNRKNSYCCGAGDGTRGNAFPEYSKWIARERIEEFRETKADILITSCSYCKDMFKKVLPPKQRGKVKDLIEFVDEMIQ